MVGYYQEDFLLGEGLSEREAAYLTYKETKARIDAADKKKWQQWEIMRWNVYTMISLAPIEKRYKPKSLQDLLKLPTDKPKEYNIVPVSDEEIEALKKIFNITEDGTNREDIC